MSKNRNTTHTIVGLHGTPDYDMGIIMATGRGQVTISPEVRMYGDSEALRHFGSSLVELADELDKRELNDADRANDDADRAGV